MLAARASKQGVSVIGKYPEYMELAEGLNARRFMVPADAWNKMTSAEQWAANAKFLDRMIVRGDRVFLATRVTEITKATGAFRKELEYLAERGYKLAFSGWEMVK